MFGDIVTKTISYDGTQLEYSFYATDNSGEGCISEIINKNSYRLHRFKNIKNDVILDIGANCGLVTIILAKQNPESLIVALEPISELCDIILKNVKDNGITNVTLHNEALHTNSNGTTLFLANSCSGASSTNVGNLDAFYTLESSSSSRFVNTTTYDDLCYKYDIVSRPLIILKIDCEGGEYSLKDSNMFHKNGVVFLEGEFHDTPYKKDINFSAQELFEYCKPCIVEEMSVTILTRNTDLIHEHTLNFKK